MATEKRLIDANIAKHKINAFAASVVYRGSDLMITGKDSCNPHEYTRGYQQGVLDATNIITGQDPVDAVEVVHGRIYTAHEVAEILAEAFGDSCACNFNGIDEWLPEKCELASDCPNPVGVACWEQYLKFRKTKMDGDGNG